jgi:hypothetical protein
MKGAVQTLFQADREAVLDAIGSFEGGGFASQAFEALRTGTQLDPNEGDSRPSLNVVFGDHRGGTQIYAPPQLLAMRRDRRNGKLNDRDLVDAFYRKLPKNGCSVQHDEPSGKPPQWEVDMLGCYRMCPSKGAEITLWWDRLRLAALDYSREHPTTSEPQALKALARYVFLHELGHYSTHWGKRLQVVSAGGSGEANFEEEWRKEYLAWNSPGARCLQEGMTELACETAIATGLKTKAPWEAVQKAKQWLNGRLKGDLKKTYVTSVADIKGLWTPKGQEFADSGHEFWQRTGCMGAACDTIVICGVPFYCWKQRWSMVCRSVKGHAAQPEWKAVRQHVKDLKKECCAAAKRIKRASKKADVNLDI